MKYLSLVLVLLLSSNVFAGEWTEPLSVVDVSLSYSEGRFNISQLRATFDKPPATSVCAATENIAVYDSNGINDYTKSWLSVLMSAQAQNKKVRIYMTFCRDNNVPHLHGVKILSQ